MAESVVPKFIDLDSLKEVATFPCLYHHLMDLSECLPKQRNGWRNMLETNRSKAQFYRLNKKLVMIFFYLDTLEFIF